MAKGVRKTVSTTVVVLVPEGMVATIKNRDATNSVDLGGSGVAAGAGYELKAGESITVDTRGEALYAIRSTADVRVDVIALRAIQV